MAWAVTWRLEEYYTWQHGGIEPHAVCRVNKAANMTACDKNVLCVSYFVKQQLNFVTLLVVGPSNSSGLLRNGACMSHIVL